MGKEPIVSRKYLPPDGVSGCGASRSKMGLQVAAGYRQSSRGPSDDDGDDDKAEGWPTAAPTRINISKENACPEQTKIGQA
jgi:hypothetical protein